jgi:hypothetical protein
MRHTAARETARWTLHHGQLGTSQKWNCEGKDPAVEEALNQGFSIVTGQGVRVSGPMLKRKRKELAKKLGHKDFKATDDWLSQWIHRLVIRMNKVHGKKASADAVSAEQQKSTRLPNLLHKFCTDDIYNDDETGLFHHAALDGSLSYKHATLSGFKESTGLCNCAVLFKHVRN